MFERISVANLRDGGLLFWLVRLYLFAALALAASVLFVGAGFYVHFARQVPPVPELEAYFRTVPGVTTFYALDGTILAELATERREVVPLERVPRPLIDAFLSTEDRRFYQHSGLDVRGTLRAVLADLRAGQVRQGGSTITQQVAKSFLSSERSWSRKIKEAILARRLEARYSKQEILTLYLNQIFLGGGAYGVAAAARRYFDKDLDELDLGEMAVIAGLARAPSKYSPLVDQKAAHKRRDDVLDNLVEAGAATAEDVKPWKASPIVTRPRRDYFHAVTPYFSEQVRRELLKSLGQKALYEGGYRVETTVLPWVDAVAQDNVDYSARKLDKRQGWRGPELRLDEVRADTFRRRARALYGATPLEEGRLYLGLVESVSASAAQVRIGANVYPLPVRNLTWAFPFSKSDATNDKSITSANEALKRFDVVWVKWDYRARVPRFTEFNYNEEGDAAWLPERGYKAPPHLVELTLEQSPRIEAALYTFDHRTGYVLAMTGGDDFDRSEFNRVTQACRQPGSALKPLYYSLALDRGYSYDTLWVDKLKAEVDPTTGELWIPQNVDGSYSAQVTLERALVWSKNPPSVEIFKTLGTKDVETWAHRLGLSTPIVTSPKCEKEFCSALALGASCVHMDDMAHVFGVFARSGVPIAPVLIRRVFDRAGKIIEDHATPDDPWLDADDKLNRWAAESGRPHDPVIPPRTAYLTSKLLREVVTTGHSAPIRATKLIAAGKTGTSSRTSDVWFFGYTSRWLTAAWMGDDTYQRQLGFKDASFMLSVPLWARYMAEVSADQPLEEIPWTRPVGVRANDTGGPLKPGFPPPPLSIAPPPALPGTAKTFPAGTPPPNLVRPKTVRVLGAPPRPPKPSPAAQPVH